MTGPSCEIIQSELWKHIDPVYPGSIFLAKLTILLFLIRWTLSGSPVSFNLTSSTSFLILERFSLLNTPMRFDVHRPVAFLRAQLPCVSDNLSSMVGVAHWKLYGSCCSKFLKNNSTTTTNNRLLINITENSKNIFLSCLLQTVHNNVSTPLSFVRHVKISKQKISN